MLKIIALVVIAIVALSLLGLAVHLLFSPWLLVAIAIYVPIVYALVSTQRWIERRQARLEAPA